MEKVKLGKEGFMCSMYGTITGTDCKTLRGCKCSGCFIYDTFKENKEEKECQMNIGKKE